MHHPAHCQTMYPSSDQGSIIPLPLPIPQLLRRNKGEQSHCTVFQQITACAIFIKRKKKKKVMSSHLWMQAQFPEEEQAFHPVAPPPPISATAAVVQCWRAVLKLTACSADKESSQWKERSSSSSSSPLSRRVNRQRRRPDSLILSHNVTFNSKFIHCVRGGSFLAWRAQSMIPLNLPELQSLVSPFSTPHHLPHTHTRHLLHS